MRYREGFGYYQGEIWCVAGRDLVFKREGFGGALFTPFSGVNWLFTGRNLVLRA